MKAPNEMLYLIVDDTSNPKRGKHVEAAFWFFEHTLRRYAKHAYASLVYVVEQVHQHQGNTKCPSDKKATTDFL